MTDTVTPDIVLTGVINGEAVEHECKSKRMIILECTECGNLDKTVKMEHCDHCDIMKYGDQRYAVSRLKRAASILDVSVDATREEIEQAYEKIPGGEYPTGLSGKEMRGEELNSWVEDVLNARCLLLGYSQRNCKQKHSTCKLTRNMF